MRKINTVETPRFTSSPEIRSLFSENEAKQHERPGSLRRSIMDTERPLELPHGTVVVQVGPSTLNEKSIQKISQAVDNTPVSAFNNEKGYAELDTESLVPESISIDEGKVALLYDSSVKPDENMARTPAAVLVLDALTDKQLADLRKKLPEGVPLLDAKTNKIIEVQEQATTNTLSTPIQPEQNRAQSSHQTSTTSRRTSRPGSSPQGYVYGSVPIDRVVTPIAQPEMTQEGWNDYQVIVTPATPAERQAELDRVNKERHDQQIAREQERQRNREAAETRARQYEIEDAHQAAIDEEKTRDAVAKSIVQREIWQAEYHQQQERRKRDKAAREADIQQRAADLRKAREGVKEALN